MTGNIIYCRIQLGIKGIVILFKSIFLNFYCILAIVLVPVLAFTGKDFGPMAAAEKRAAETGLLDDARHGAKEEVEAATSGATPRACNLLAPIGTPLSYLAEQAGGLKCEPGKVIIGGPMLGVTVASMDELSKKATNSVLFITVKEARQFEPSASIR